MGTGRNRAVTPVLGFVLLLGILVMAVAMWQTQILPEDNSDHEFRHYQDLTTDLTNLQNTIIAAATGGNTQRADITIGTRYPSRVVLVNPAPVSGNLDTEGSRTVAFENVRAVASEAKNTRSRWQDSLTFQDITTGIVATADYNYNTDATLPPAVVTGETVYSAPDTSVISVSDQTLIDGNRIRMTFLTGNLSVTGQDASVVVEPQSSSLRTVTLTGNESGNPIRLRLDPPPRVTADEWIAEYENQLTESSNRVTNVLTDNGDIVIELQSSQTYHLQLSSVKVGGERTQPDRLDPAYITTYQGDGQSVDSGQNATIIAEVRDKFNNPVREANVTFNVTSGDGSLQDSDGNTITGTRTISTDADGRVVQRVLVKSIGDDVIVEASIDGQTGQLSSTEFTIQTPEESNPVQLAGVQFNEATRDGSGDLQIQFENVIEDDRVIEKFRMDFYRTSSGGEGPSSGEIQGNDFDIGGAAITVNFNLPATQTTSFEVNFDNYNPSQSGDWFIMTVTYDTGESGQYFAAV